MKLKLKMVAMQNWLSRAIFWLSFPKPEAAFASRQKMLDTRRRILKKLSARLREERRAVCDQELVLPASSLDPAT